MRNKRPSIFPNDVEATEGQTVITVVSMTDGGETPAIDCIVMEETCLEEPEMAPTICLPRSQAPGLHRNDPAVGGKSLPLRNGPNET